MGRQDGYNADSVGTVGIARITAGAAIVGGLIVAVSNLLVERSQRKSEEKREAKKTSSSLGSTS
jgi:hypothetical protein